MNHLHRELAPISDAAWDLIDDEAKSRLPTYLAARKLVDFAGPHGWNYSSTSLGRIKEIAGPSEGVAAPSARSSPSSSCVPSSRSRALSSTTSTAAPAPPTWPSSTRRCARSRWARTPSSSTDTRLAGSRASPRASSHEPIAIADIAQAPDAVARGVEALRQAGIDGPYGLAICPDMYTTIVETTEMGGELLKDHLRKILGGPLVWAPGIEGGVVLSLRGGDFKIESGQDLSIGYLDHDADVVRLYLEESLNFRVLEPDAAVAISLGKKK